MAGIYIKNSEQNRNIANRLGHTINKLANGKYSVTRNLKGMFGQSFTVQLTAHEITGLNYQIQAPSAL